MDQIVVGALFENKAELTKACQKAATSGNFEYSIIKSDRTRLTIKCSGNGCLWRMHASKIGNSKDSNGVFEIKTMGELHKCLGNQKLSHRQASTDFIANMMQEKLRENPSYRARDIQRDLRLMLGISVPYLKANRAKTAALQAINGTDEESYHALPKYCEDLSRNNPGSKIVLESTPDEEVDQRFQRMFVCYSASAMGFVYCPPVLGLDGTHLKAKYKGLLLTATAIDANGSLFPLASAVVDAENDDNWIWFIQLLHDVIEEYAPALLEPQALTFISDRQKGLLSGVQLSFPNSPHGYCLRHLYENMYKEFKHPMLKVFLFKAARATTKEEFDKALEDINTLHPHALDWLLQHAEPKHWAEYYFPGHRY